MKKQIEILLKDIDMFAEISAAINPNKYVFDKIINEYNMYIGVTIISADLIQFKSLKEAFAALFIKNLFFSEEWSEERERYYEEPDWKKYLKKIWIPQYFCINSELEECKIQEFLTDLKGYLSMALKGNEKMANKIAEKYKDCDVLYLDKSPYGTKLFGTDGKIVFFCEYGVYD